MAHIVQTLLNDDRLQLGCEEYTRRFSFGSNWTKIRVCARLAFNCTYGHIGVPAGPYIGIAQGSGGISAFATDYVGAAQNNGGNSTTAMNYIENNGNPYYTQVNNGIAVYRKVGHSITISRTNAVNHSFTTKPELRLGQLMVEFTKVSATTMTVALMTPDSTTALVGVSRESFMQNIEVISSVPNCASTSTTAAFAITSNMLWDTACIAWLKSTPTLEVADFAVVRFQ